MRRHRALLVAFISIALLGATCVGVFASFGSRVWGTIKPYPIPSEALPDAFAPVRWTTREDELPRLFAGHELTVSQFHGEPFWRSYQWQTVDRVPSFLGETQLGIEFVVPDGLGVAPEPQVCTVQLLLEDPRPECRAEGRAAPDRCWRKPGRPLEKAVEVARREMERRLGPPKHDEADAAASQAFTWDRTGFEIELRLETSEPAPGEHPEFARWRLELLARTPESDD